MLYFLPAHSKPLHALPFRVSPRNVLCSTASTRNTQIRGSYFGIHCGLYCLIAKGEQSERVTMRFPHDKYTPKGLWWDLLTINTLPNGTVTKKRESGTNTVGQTDRGFLYLTQGKQSEAWAWRHTNVCSISRRQKQEDYLESKSRLGDLWWALSQKEAQWHKLAIPNSPSDFQASHRCLLRVCLGRENLRAS